MKRLFRNQSTIELHLSDIVKSIDHIVICENLIQRPYIISADTDVDEDELTDEQFYITLTDSEIAGLPIDKLHSFTNIELLGRIAKIDYSLLTVEQKEAIKKAFSRKVILSESDVQKILNMIKGCTSVSYEGQHWKTNKFLKGPDGKIRKQDCLDILHQLTIEDYVANSKSFNLNHIGNHLIIFEPDSDWELADGTILSDIKIYVKLDIDETDGSAAALISMHQAAYDDDRYPYRK